MTQSNTVSTVPAGDDPNNGAGSNSASSIRTQMLLDFLRQFDAPCPLCGYNLRALTRPICPECGHELMLTVGIARLRLAWLLVAVAPGFFSGIAAFFVLVMIVLRFILGDQKMSIGLNAADLFGWCSGAFAIILAIHRTRFLTQSRARQRTFALLIWGIHIAALATLLILARLYL